MSKARLAPTLGNNNNWKDYFSYALQTQWAIERRPLLRSIESARHNAMMVPFIALNNCKPVTVGGARVQCLHASEAKMKDNKFLRAEAAHVALTPINDAQSQKSILTVVRDLFNQNSISSIAPNLKYLCVRAERAAGDVEFLGAAYNRAEYLVEAKLRLRADAMIKNAPQLIKQVGIANAMETIYRQSLEVFSHANFISSLKETYERMKHRKAQHPDCPYCLPIGSEPIKLTDFYLAGNGAYSTVDLKNEGDSLNATLLHNAKIFEAEVEEVLESINSTTK